jgi:hypothetical protein
MTPHATAKLGEFTVPLIGIPKSATEDACDGCGALTHIRELFTDGTGFLCLKCLQNRES